MKVPDLSYEKTVGIVWTDDAWSTTNVTTGSCELTHSDGSEQWGVDLIPIGELTVHRSMGPIRWNGTNPGYPHRQVVIEYAIFYTLPDGTTM